MINQERLKEIESKALKRGKGKTIDEVCIMQMVSYIADEPWSDHPACACPILTKYAICLNDSFNDKHREEMKPFIPLLVGTKSTDAIQTKRKQLLMWRHVTAVYPLILDLINMSELATQLRAFNNCVPDMNLASILLKKSKELIKKDANVNAYAYDDVYVLRGNILIIALETLRMAIEVKE